MKKEKIIYIVLALIAVVAIIVTAINGLNLSLKYSQSKQVQVEIGKEFDSNDIKNIVKEVIGNDNIIVQKVEVYEEIAAITLNDITDEQKEQLNTKINEKYELDSTVEDKIIVYDIPNLKLDNAISYYIIPVAISLVIILIYAGIKYRKIEIIKVLGRVIGLNILAELLYFCILSIARIQVNDTTIPIGLAIYIIVTLIVFNSFETENEKIDDKKSKK